MATRKMVHVLCLVLALAVGTVSSASADEPGPVVRAVIFHSPTCAGCRYVLEEVLPPMEREYGSLVDIEHVDASTSGGRALFDSAADQYDVPSAERGVPMLCVGDKFLVGSLDIEQQLPALIDAGLAAGGIDWPAIPGLHPNIVGTAIVVAVVIAVVLAIAYVSPWGRRVRRSRARRQRVRTRRARRRRH